MIAVGTNIAGGSGTQPKVDQAVLFLWDYQTERKVWEGTLDRKVSVFNALVVGPHGRVYGTIQGKGVEPELFVFDPKSHKFIARVPLPGGKPLDLGLQNGPDGKIYGFTSSCIYQLDPNSLAMAVIIEEAFSVAGPILEKNIYFATGHILRTARIFE